MALVSHIQPYSQCRNRDTLPPTHPPVNGSNQMPVDIAKVLTNIILYIILHKNMEAFFIGDGLDALGKFVRVVSGTIFGDGEPSVSTNQTSQPTETSSATVADTEKPQKENSVPPVSSSEGSSSLPPESQPSEPTPESLEKTTEQIEAERVAALKESVAKDLGMTDEAKEAIRIEKDASGNDVITLVKAGENGEEAVARIISKESIGRGESDEFIVATLPGDTSPFTTGRELIAMGVMKEGDILYFTDHEADDVKGACFKNNDLLLLDYSGTSSCEPAAQNIYPDFEPAPVEESSVPEEPVANTEPVICPTQEKLVDDAVEKEIAQPGRATRAELTLTNADGKRIPVVVVEGSISPESITADDVLPVIDAALKEAPLVNGCKTIYIQPLTEDGCLGTPFCVTWKDDGDGIIEKSEVPPVPPVPAVEIKENGTPTAIKTSDQWVEVLRKNNITIVPR